MDAYDLILQTLSRDEWKDTDVISRDVKDVVKKAREGLTSPSRQVQAFIDDFKHGTVYFTLVRMETDGFVDARFVPLNSPGSSMTKTKQYKLTDDGVRRKVESEENIPDGLEGVLLQPQPI